MFSWWNRTRAGVPDDLMLVGDDPLLLHPREKWANISWVSREKRRDQLLLFIVVVRTWHHGVKRGIHMPSGQVSTQAGVCQVRSDVAAAYRLRSCRAKLRPIPSSSLSRQQQESACVRFGSSDGFWPPEAFIPETWLGETLPGGWPALPTSRSPKSGVPFYGPWILFADQSGTRQWRLGVRPIVTGHVPRTPLRGREREQGTFLFPQC